MFKMSQSLADEDKQNDAPTILMELYRLTTVMQE
jgi:hypothetical protein